MYTFLNNTFCYISHYKHDNLIIGLHLADGFIQKLNYNIGLLFLL